MFSALVATTGLQALEGLWIAFVFFFGLIAVVAAFVTFFVARRKPMDVRLLLSFGAAIGVPLVVWFLMMTFNLR